MNFLEYLVFRAEAVYLRPRKHYCGTGSVSCTGADLRIELRENLTY